MTTMSLGDLVERIIYWQDMAEQWSGSGQPDHLSYGDYYNAIGWNMVDAYLMQLGGQS